MAPLVLLLPFGPLARWQREQASRPLAMLVPWAGLALGIGIAAFFLAPQGAWKVAAGVAGAAWVLLGTAALPVDALAHARAAASPPKCSA